MPIITHKNRLTGLAKTLEGQGMDRQSIVEQSVLLAAWAWCVRDRPELGLPLPEEQPGITTAIVALKNTLHAAHSTADPDSQFLELSCTGQAVQKLQAEVAALDWPDATTLIYELAGLAERYQRRLTPMSLPPDLARLMATLGKTANRHVLGAYALSDLPLALATNAEKRAFVSDTCSALSIALALIGDTSVSKDAPENGQRKANVVLATPPLAAKRTANKQSTFQSNTSEGVGLQSAWETSSYRAVVLVTPGLLSGHKDAVLRESLIRANGVDQVIQLPQKTLPSTHMSPVLLVLDHQRPSDAPLFFVDANRLLNGQSDKHSKSSVAPSFWNHLSELLTTPADGRASKFVNSVEVKDNSFDLSIGRYVHGPATQRITALSNTRSLAEIAEIIRAQSFKEDDAADGETFIEIGVRDIDESGRIAPQEPAKRIRVAGNHLKRARQQQLQAGDILLVGKGGAARVALITPDVGENWTASQVFLLIRSRKQSGIQAEYLYQYLASPLAQQYLAEITSESSIPVLKSRDIRGLRVPIPSTQEHADVVTRHQKIMAEHDAIAGHHAEIRKLTPETWSN